MARSKKVSTKKAKKTKKQGFNEKPKDYQLKENEFLKWKLLESEVNVAKLDMDKTMLELQLLKIKNPSILKLEDKFLSIKQEFTKKKNEYMVYVKDICQEFGLNENKICINDETGSLIEVE